MSDVTCPVNLGPKQIRKRQIGGALALGIAAVLTVVGLWNGAGTGLRLAIVLAVAFGSLALLQARAKT